MEILVSKQKEFVGESCQKQHNFHLLPLSSLDVYFTNIHTYWVQCDKLLCIQIVERQPSHVINKPIPSHCCSMCVCVPMLTMLKIYPLGNFKFSNIVLLSRSPRQ